MRSDHIDFREIGKRASRAQGHLAAAESASREASGHLAVVESTAGQIARNANDWADEAIRARTYDGDGRGGGDETHPERWAAPFLDAAHGRRKKPDSVEVQVGEFFTKLELADQTAEAAKDAAQFARNAATKARAAANAVVDAGSKLIVNTDEDARRLTAMMANTNRSPGEGYCSNCPHYCRGGDDRLRGGRCEPCSKYWLRHHRAEERPKDLWGAPIEDAPPCPSERWSGGVTLKCHRGLGHQGEHAGVDGEGARVPWQNATVEVA